MTERPVEPIGLDAVDIPVERCVPDDDQPHGVIDGHHVSWCPCGAGENEPGPWDGWFGND